MSYSSDRCFLEFTIIVEVGVCMNSCILLAVCLITVSYSDSYVAVVFLFKFSLVLS